MSSVNEIKSQFDTFLEEMDKFQNKGNKTAGTRARKALLEIGKLCKTVRGEIQETKKT